MLNRSELIEAIVCVSTIMAFRPSFARMKILSTRAPAEAGQLKSLPRTTLGRLISPIHAFALFAPILVHLLGVTFCGFRQPQWLQAYSLPPPLEIAKFMGVTSRVIAENEEAVKAAVRVTACGAAYGFGVLSGYVLDYLGNQWSGIGIREKPRLISSGPYGIVRHPAYTCALSIQLCLVPMFWSSIPLFAAGIVGSAFAIKMPIEEGLIEEDPIVGAEYKEYKKTVRSRIIPGLW
jgi:protein-S-isoprenylcysteine O-methyltransferase Ste14